MVKNIVPATAWPMNLLILVEVLKWSWLNISLEYFKILSRYYRVIQMLLHIIERKWKSPIDERININFQLSQYLFILIICNYSVRIKKEFSN